MKIIFKILLFGIVVCLGYYVYIARFSNQESTDFLNRILTSHQNKNQGESSEEQSDTTPAQDTNATSNKTQVPTPNTTTSLSTANFNVQKCVTPDGRVIYVDHVKAGQCKNITNETKSLRVAHTETGTANNKNSAQTPFEETNTTPSQFKCDGRTRCTQMTSCEEAKFFLHHCPSVEMDGDNDGIPCEQQWCH